MAMERMNLLLMGMRGVGKSATGNKILGQTCFQEYCNTTSAGTKDVHCNTRRFDNISVSVVDSPALINAETIEERAGRAREDMFKALTLCNYEIDAFVLVVSYDSRCMQDDKTTIGTLEIIFGKNYFKHLIVIMTHGDSFIADMEANRTRAKSFDTWCSEQTGAFKQLITACNGRLVLFNNTEKDALKIRAQRRQLIQIVRDLQRENGKYTRQALQDAKEVPDSFIERGKSTYKMAVVRMNLLLMGKMGVGKSSTGNKILGQKCFKEYSKMTSGTMDVQFNTGRFGDYAVCVVDPPGLMDTETKEEERAERAGADMLEALMWCGGEIDAFVLVIRYGARFTEEDRDTLEILKRLFGEDYFKYLIVVLTHGDSFPANMEHEGTPGKSFDTWCDEQKGPFKQLITDCKGRFVLFNNREIDEVKKHAQRQKLIQLVKEVQRNNGKYTCETFEDANELREKFIREQKATLLKKNILTIIGLLTTDIQRLADAPEESEIEHIKQGIEDLQNEIKLVDKSTGDYTYFMDIVAHLQENLHDRAELNRLSQELHAAQISEMERVAKLARGAYIAFVLAATGVGAPLAAVCGAGTAMYAFVSKIHNNRRFKRIYTKIAEVTAKIARSKTKNRQTEAGSGNS